MSSPFDQLTSKDSAAPNRFHDNKYGDADRREIATALERGAPSEIAPAALNAAIHRIEDAATEYLALKGATQPFPARGEQRKQLDRLSNARPSLFKKAALALHPALWPSIAMRAEELSHDQQVKLIRPLREPDDMDAETMMRYRSIIQAAAAKARRDIKELSSKPGPRVHILVAHFAWSLAPIYEEITGKAPKAHRIPSYERSRERATPFVRFIEACLKPIDEAAVKPNLGEIIYKFLPKRGKAGLAR